jgi:hypothetical protein
METNKAPSSEQHTSEYREADEYEDWRRNVGSLREEHTHGVQKQSGVGVFVGY